MKNNINIGPFFQPCTSCQICAAVCPKGAITIIENEEGFYRPVVDEEKCIDCGICRRYCYKCRKFENKKELRHMNVMAVQAKDKYVLQESTSGGIAGILADYLFEQGYHVVGVGYDYYRDRAITERADTKDKLIEFRGSKYMQSYTEKAFKEIVQSNEERYAVFGTPCQIFALGEWAEATGNRERFLFVDIFCHGCSSLLLWDKYVQSYKNEMQTDRFDKIVFRSKAYGWHEYAHIFQKENKRTISNKTINDPFFVIFFDNHILNEACYECRLRSDFFHTDMRLGDFWGRRYDTNTDGISAVVICSSKAEEVFNGIRTQLKCKNNTSFEEIAKAQSYGKNYSMNLGMRKKTFLIIKNSEDIDTAFRNYLKEYSGKQKVKRMLKKAIYCLPASVRMKIKKLYHTIGNC